MAVDPLGDDFPGWSPYNYVLNNPILRNDPDGKMPCPPCNGSFGSTLRQTFGSFKSGFDNLASSLGLEQVTTSPPPVYKGAAAVKQLAKGVGIGAASVGIGATIYATGGTAMGLIGAGEALIAADVAAVSFTVASRSAVVEASAAFSDAVSGGESTVADIVIPGFVGPLSTLAGNRLIAGPLASIADDVLAGVGDPVIDAGLQSSQQLVTDVTHLCVIGLP